MTPNFEKRLNDIPEYSLSHARASTHQDIRRLVQSGDTFTIPSTVARLANAMPKPTLMNTICWPSPRVATSKIARTARILAAKRLTLRSLHPVEKTRGRLAQKPVVASFV